MKVKHMRGRDEWVMTEAVKKMETAFVLVESINMDTSL